MRLYLVQHGQAQSKDQDPQKPLTRQGLAETGKVAEFARSLPLRVGMIWHSDKTRARQTAEVLAPAAGASDGLVERDDLAPTDDTGPVREEIELAKTDLMIVGHLPFLSRLSSHLLTGTDTSDVVAFRNSGIVCLDRDLEGTWRLVWAVTPDLL